MNWHKTCVRPQQAFNMVPQGRVSGNRASERPHSLVRYRVRALDLELEGDPACAHQKRRGCEIRVRY